MRDLTDRALDTAKTMGASYADIRIVHKRVQSIIVKNEVVETINESESYGFGVRVVCNGAWGFASSSILSLAEIDEITALAVRIAKASSIVQSKPVDLGEAVRSIGSYRTPVKIDPFAVPLRDKVDLLLNSTKTMLAVQGIAVAQGEIEIQREHKTFASTEGSYVEQELIETGCGIEATAVGEMELQNRSYPNSVGRHQATEGWEFVQRYDLAGNSQRIAEEAAALLSAKPCPAGITTVVLDGSQVALQIHESCGHAIELDRVMGMEAAFAGTSFLTLEKLGGFKYGSPLVNMTADATIAGGLGTFGYDDEGVPAQSVLVVRDGIFKGYLTSRETASQIGQRSNGTMRADGWNRIPLIRMTNVNLEPGDKSFNEIISEVDDGIYMQTNRSWSIDDKRLNFQFGTEIAWEIKKGKLGDMLKNATYTGITPQFWGSCDAVANRDHWVVWGTPNCGKGQPGQTGHTGHGAAPARFRNIQVGLMK
ncbi:MAG: TldD/PmbA family protein [Dehalococcoidia bacterium]|nr:TldD/PmbA family protein [Dehalococcoidia bacterium]